MQNALTGLWMLCPAAGAACSSGEVGIQFDVDGRWYNLYADGRGLVYRGLGSDRFSSTPVAFNVGTNPTGLAIGDVNGDGLADLAVANSGSNDVSVLYSTGSGSTWSCMC